MAHVLLVLSGLADDPCDELDGQTPLASAPTPTLDALAARSEVGLLQPLPGEPAIGADRAFLALLGYEPGQTGRGALELLGAGGSLGGGEAGVRLDLISLAGGCDPFPAAPKADEAALLWHTLGSAISRRGLALRGVKPLKGLALWDNGPVEVQSVPPGELTDPLAQLPTGEQEAELRRLIDISREVLADCDLNKRRAEAGLPTLDLLWPWGFGRAPEFPLFVLRAGTLATVLSDHLGVRGAARAVGVNSPRQPEGLKRKVQDVAPEILAHLDQVPTIFSHTTAIDRAAHTGDPVAKRAALAALDQHVLKPLWTEAKAGKLDLTVLGDYACLSGTRRHDARPVPFAAFRCGRSIAGPGRFDETTAAETGHERHGVGELRQWLWGR